MKASGITHIAMLALVLGLVALACAAQDRPSEGQGPPKTGQHAAAGQARSDTRNRHPADRSSPPANNSGSLLNRRSDSQLSSRDRTSHRSGLNNSHGRRRRRSFPPSVSTGAHPATAGRCGSAAEPGSRGVQQSCLAAASGGQLAVGPPHLAAARRLSRLSRSRRPFSRLLWTGPRLPHPRAFPSWWSADIRASSTTDTG